MVKPLLKWVGGKTQILDTILNNIPIKFNNYHELFIGGGSVLLGLLQKFNNGDFIINKFYAYDFNLDLINVYNCVKNNPEKLYENIIVLINNYNSCPELKGNRKPVNFEDSLKSKESYYYWIRKQYNTAFTKSNNIYLRSAMFIFMNKTCFRGMYRCGPNGFNVPFGNYKNPTIIDKNNLMNVHKLIQNVEFIHLDFSKSIKLI